MDLESPIDPLDDNLGLDEEDIDHLKRLRAAWGLVADFAFGDLLLYVPSLSDQGNYVIVGQVRPSTSQTLYPQDLIGKQVPIAEVPIVAEALVSGRIVNGTRDLGERPDPVLISAIPVRRVPTKTLGVVTMVWEEEAGRRPGQLEHTYHELATGLSRMIAEGAFPFPGESVSVEEAPRVGDGVLVIDSHGLVSFASPNSVSVLHRTGVHIPVVGSQMEDLGIGVGAMQGAFASQVPVIEEIERRGDIYILAQCVPILAAKKITGAFILLRDVTELRRRDRLLLTKDAAIREVHHRVKNNLQTISSLLRLQTRRLDEPKATEALREAERRIRSIAIVHEILSRDSASQVPFNEIVRSLVRLATDTVMTERPIEIKVHGDAGAVLAEIATPLAVAVAELLQNAVEHAFEPVDNEKDESGEVGTIDLVLSHSSDLLTVEVRDNGVGLPDGFTLDSTGTLGLSLVRDLVRSQMAGELTLFNDGGTVARLTIPISPTRAPTTVEI